MHDTVRKEVDHEPIEKNANNSQYERPRRNAAIKNRDNIREMISAGILKVNKTNIPKPPTHAWNWSTFRDLVDAEDDITIVRFMADPGTESVSREENSPGTCSPLVNYAPLSPTRTYTEPLHISDGDSDQDDDGYDQYHGYRNNSDLKPYI